jgi:hypothetical protein
MPVVEADFCTSRTAWAVRAFGSPGTPIRALCSKNWRGKCTGKPPHGPQCVHSFSGKKFTLPIEWHTTALDAFESSREETEKDQEAKEYIEKAVSVFPMERVAAVALSYPRMWIHLRREVFRMGPQQDINARTFMLLSHMSAIPRSCMPALGGITDARKLTAPAARAERYLRWLTHKDKIHPEDAPFLAVAIREALAPLAQDTAAIVTKHLFASTPAVPLSI